MAVEKFRKLVDLLDERTNDKLLKWVAVADRTVVQTRIGNRMVQLSEQGNDYYVDILNAEGDSVDSFSDVTIQEFSGYNSENVYLIKLRNLYNEARRQATGADEALEGVISELEDMMPF